MQHKPYGPYERYIKRPLDCILAIFAFVFLLPVLGVIALLVRINLGTPIIFSQARPGRNECIFKLNKFRSMTSERDERGELLPDDLRLTKFGRFLRSTSMDEFPELVNIIKGDMAIVGPRPLLVDYLPYYEEQERLRHTVRPGLTGLAQINGRNAGTWKQKFDFDIKYVNNITFKNDFIIIIKTVAKVINRSDVLVGSQIEAGRLDDARRDISVND